VPGQSDERIKELRLGPLRSARSLDGSELSCGEAPGPASDVSPGRREAWDAWEAWAASETEGWREVSEAPREQSAGASGASSGVGEEDMGRSREKVVSAKQHFIHIHSFHSIRTLANTLSLPRLKARPAPPPPTTQPLLSSHASPAHSLSPPPPTRPLALQPSPPPNLFPPH
jgi:hypothetical protein